MSTDMSPPDEVGTADAVGDALISEIVEQEVATAVADPDTVYVLSLRYRGDDYTSVHTTQSGAQARLEQIAAQWGVADVMHTEQLSWRIEKLPIETP